MPKKCVLAFTFAVSFFHGIRGFAYQISELPMPVGATSTGGGQASSNGWFTGEAYFGSDSNEYSLPVVWHNGAVKELPAPQIQGVSGFTSGINSSGVVVGGGFAGSSVPILWQNGNYQNLSTGTWDGASPTAINASGQIVGEATNNTNGIINPIAVSWSNGQPISLLSTPHEQSSAQAINNSGQILIDAYDNNSSMTYVLTNGTLTTLPGLISGGGTQGVAMNDAGTVVGAGDAANGEIHAFVYANGVTTDLETTPGDSSSANAINTSGEIIGWSQSVGESPEVMLWVNGEAYNLQDLLPADSGWTIESATGITDDGEIIGSGIFDGQQEAFLLTPTSADLSAVTPEPASASLLLLGTTLLLRRNRRDSAQI